MKNISTVLLLVPNTADELTYASQALNVAREAVVKGTVYFLSSRARMTRTCPTTQTNPASKE
jgi:hypothetical protein